MLDNLCQYTIENGMQINFDKTKAMIFNKNGFFFRRNFNFGATQIFSTNSYKYLGFIVTPSGEISTGLNDLKDRASRAYFKLKKAMGSFFRSHPNVTLHLFDTLIIPILGAGHLKCRVPGRMSSYGGAKHFLGRVMGVRNIFWENYGGSKNFWEKIWGSQIFLGILQISSDRVPGILNDPPLTAIIISMMN